MVRIYDSYHSPASLFGYVHHCHVYFSSPPSLFLVLVSVINSIIDRGSKVWITISQMQ